MIHVFDQSVRVSIVYLHTPFEKRYKGVNAPIAETALDWEQSLGLNVAAQGNQLIEDIVLKKFKMTAAAILNVVSDVCIVGYDFRLRRLRL